MKSCCLALFSVGLLLAQIRSVGIKPTLPASGNAASSNPLPRVEKRAAVAGPPILGYQLGPQPTELRAILGTSKAPQMGDSVIVPENSRRLYLPPMQQYALLERNSDDAVAVWAMHKTVLSGASQEPTAIGGAMAHPDIVAFSPRANALVLYSQINANAQVVSHLPSQPVIVRQLSISNLATPLRIAVSDDAALIVAALADGTLMSSCDGAGWQLLPGGFTVQALSFIPGTHDLAISDTSQKSILLLPDLNEGPKPFHIVAQNVPADDLAFSKDGEKLLAADKSAGRIWTIDLKSGTVVPTVGIAGVNTLSSLRDGFTFVVSSSPALALLRLGVSPNSNDQALVSGVSGQMQTVIGNR